MSVCECFWVCVCVCVFVWVRVRLCVCVLPPTLTPQPLTSYPLTSTLIPPTPHPTLTLPHPAAQYYEKLVTPLGPIDATVYSTWDLMKEMVSHTYRHCRRL